MTDLLVRLEPSGVATVTLNRPARRNAVTLAMWRELRERFAGLGEDPAVRVVVLTGAGGHFCAGTDITEFDAVREPRRSSSPAGGTMRSRRGTWGWSIRSWMTSAKACAPSQRS